LFLLVFLFHSLTRCFISSSSQNPARSHSSPHQQVLLHRRDRSLLHAGSWAHPHSTHCICFFLTPFSPCSSFLPSFFQVKVTVVAADEISYQDYLILSTTEEPPLKVAIPMKASPPAPDIQFERWRSVCCCRFWSLSSSPVLPFLFFFPSSLLLILSQYAGYGHGRSLSIDLQSFRAEERGSAKRQIPDRVRR
jgi:hypothetical protein